MCIITLRLHKNEQVKAHKARQHGRPGLVPNSIILIFWKQVGPKVCIQSDESPFGMVKYKSWPSYEYTEVLCKDYAWNVCIMYTIMK